MKVAIYSPYLDTAGGGEKYILTIAKVLSDKEEVDVLLDAHLKTVDIQKLKEKLKKLHNLDFSKIKFINSPIGESGAFFKKLTFLRNYDWLFLNIYCF